LEVGIATQEITVTGAAPILKTDRADTSKTIERQDLEDLPSPGRNFTRLALLAPGMVHSTGELQDYAENPGEDYQFFSNGQYWGNASKTLDGVDNQEVIQGFMMLVPSEDSVQEMKVTTTDYDVEIGQAATAAVQVTTRSGSNAYHGSAFEEYKANSMFARDPFTQPDGVPHYIWNQFGGTMGGAIKKDKLFFFGDYQGMRNVVGASLLATVPTAAFRAGDFSAFKDIYPIYDPATGNPDGTGRTQFADPTRATADNPLGLNIIPLNRITSQATKILGLVPMPTDPSLTDNNFDISGVGAYNMNQYTARIDYNHSAKTRLTGKFALMRAFYNSVNAYGVDAGGPTLGGDGKATASTSSMMVDYLRVISPAFMVDTRFGFTHELIAMHALDEGVRVADQVGIPGINTGAVNTSGMPEIDIAGPVGSWWLGDSWMPFYEHETPLSVVNIWTKVAGNHSLKWGAQIEKFYFLRQDSNGRGDLGVTQALTGSADFNAADYPAGASAGIGMASFLLGDVSSYSRRIAASTSLSSFLPQELQWRDGFFFQDTWAVTHKLTMTYGLRWEYYSPVFGAKPGTTQNVDFNTGEVVMNQGPGNKYMGIDPNYKEFAPRLGLAYRLRKDTVIRAGYGRSYGLDIWGATNCWPTAAWPVQQSQAVNPVNAYTSSFTFVSGPPAAAAIPAIPANGRLPIADGVGILGYGTGPYPHSHVDSWNLTVQHQLAPNLTMEVAYVGNVGNDLWAAENINMPVPGPGDYTTRQPFYAKFGWTQTATLGHAFTRSAYNGLQVRIDKRFSSGLEFMSNFAWSKDMDEASSLLNVQNQFNLRGDWGPSTTGSRRLASTSSFVYQLPFGQGKHFASNAKGVVGHAIGGWQLSGIVALTSGLPFTVSWGDNTLLNSPMSQRPDRIASGKLANPTRNLWYDPTAFILPPQLYTYGNSGKGILEGPGWAQTDLGLFKSFKLTEKFNLQFRWEAINAFNRTNMALPDTTASDGTAGQIFDVETPMRTMQFGLRLAW
jgi:hypothetical protein